MIFSHSNYSNTHFANMAVTHVQLTKPAAKQDSIGEFGAFTTLWGRGPDSCGTLNKRGNWDRKQKHVAYFL